MDSEERKPLMHEPRAYMAGLSDESGAAQPLAMAMKQLGMPDMDEVRVWARARLGWPRAVCHCQA